MSNPRYLVTGGAGFIGSNITAALVKAGERVRVLDNLVTGKWALLDRVVADSSKVERITGDIRDGAVVAKAMQGVEVVFHEAALGSVPRSIENPIESDHVNVNGTVTVLDCARRAGVRRLIFAASSSAYGDTPTLPKHEAMPPSPLSPYAVTKLTCEHYLQVFARLYGLETLSLRYFNVFGPNQLPDGPYAAAIPRFLTAAIKNEPIKIFGDGEQSRDFCFIDNTVKANLLAAESPKKLAGEVVNVAGGRRITLNDLIREMSKLFGRDLLVNHVEERRGDVKHSLADISRGKELIGYEPLVKWEDGLAPTLAFLRELHEKGLPAALAERLSAHTPEDRTSRRRSRTSGPTALPRASSCRSARGRAASIAPPRPRDRRDPSR